MGISVQTSGISVQKDKYYLVNLNADPSLNEMLVYYLKVFHPVFYLHLKTLFMLINCVIRSFVNIKPQFLNLNVYMCFFKTFSINILYFSIVYACFYCW